MSWLNADSVDQYTVDSFCSKMFDKLLSEPRNCHQLRNSNIKYFIMCAKTLAPQPPPLPSPLIIIIMGWTAVPWKVDKNKTALYFD